MDSSRSARFSRYELKYLVGVETLPELREAFAARLDPDPQHPDGRYAVWSLYYDSRGLGCYWEKIDGEKFRRKLRIRRYGDPWAVTDDDDVFVEIKQRLDRTISKRRIVLPYGEARRLCAGEVPAQLAGRDRTIAEEAAALAVGRDLRPIVMVGYQRQAFEGGPYDERVRVTFDRRVRGRDRDLHFGGDTTGERNAVDPSLAVLEVKVDGRVPSWITGIVANHRLSVTRLSKYCRVIDAFGRAPQSALHHPDEVQEAIA